MWWLGTKTGTNLESWLLCEERQGKPAGRAMDLCTKSQTGGRGAVKIEGRTGKAAMKRFSP